jgi:MFS family permease
LHDGGTDHLTMRAGPLPHRDETDTERHDRNLIELLQEVRVVQTGVQVLFAFLLTVPFSARFDDITGFQRAAYFTALVGATAASVLLIAPTALHRILFRMGQKEYMVDVSNRLALGGLAATAIAMIAVMLLVSDVMFGLGLAIAIALLTTLAFVGLWYAIPARRRRRVRAHYRPRRS